MSNEPGFQISARKGFHVTFENGYTVSVQFGYGNYGSNYNWPGESPDDPMSRHEGPVPKAATAEVAAWDANGKWYALAPGDVVGEQSPADVLVIMNCIAALPSAPENPS